MLIAKGKVSASDSWKILEVCIGQSPDLLAIRLSKEIKRLREPGIEILVPMRRNQSGDAEWIVEHVYVRGANGSLGQLANTPGIDFIRKELADPWWIKRLMEAEQAEIPEPETLRVGTFVRVLTGACARLCGHVTGNKRDKLTVTIKMDTKAIKLHTIAENLQVIQCDPSEQVFFYQNDLFS